MRAIAAGAVLMIAATGVLLAQAPAGRGGQGRGGQGRGGPPVDAGPPPPAVVGGIPNLAGTWDGGGRARPVNSETVPWVKGVQWPDRVLLRYEKDDQLRTVWMDGRKPTVADFSIQGFSVGRYEGNALLVETTHFTFDITGFDDYNGIPSSQQKIVRERYWRDGHDLRVTVSVEDPMFLRKPTEYTTRWVPTAPGYTLAPFECDPESARASIKFLPPKYK
jgi:hypothetical protein